MLNDEEVLEVPPYCGIWVAFIATSNTIIVSAAWGWFSLTCHRDIA
jgi:hypothetical protein